MYLINHGCKKKTRISNQKARVPNKMNPRDPPVKWWKLEIIWKTAESKERVKCKGTPIRLSADFLSKKIAWGPLMTATFILQLMNQVTLTFFSPFYWCGVKQVRLVWELFAFWIWIICFLLCSHDFIKNCNLAIFYEITGNLMLWCQCCFCLVSLGNLCTGPSFFWSLIGNWFPLYP